MQIYLTAKSTAGQNYARPRVIVVNDANIHVVPGDGGLTKVTEYDANGSKIEHIVYEAPSQIQAQSLVNAGQGTGIFAKNHAAIAVAALGATAAAAYDVVRYLTEVATGTASSADGVQLPAATVGKVRVVINSLAFALDMWPQTGEQITPSAIDALLAQAAVSRKHYVCLVAGTWVVADDYTGAAA